MISVKFYSLFYWLNNIRYCISLRCIACYFDTFIYCNTIDTFISIYCNKVAVTFHTLVLLIGQYYCLYPLQGVWHCYALVTTHYKHFFHFKEYVFETQKFKEDVRTGQQARCFGWKTPLWNWWAESISD